MKKNILGVMLGTGMLFVSVLPVFAATDSFNIATGYRSTNKSRILNKTTADVDVFNHAHVTNNITTKSESGKNDQNYNTLVLGTGIVTDPASSSTTLTNGVNSTGVLVDQTSPECGCDLSAGNSLTGAKSHNYASVKNIKDADVTVINSAYVSNTVYTASDTGHNDSNGNTVGGSISTGTATSRTNVTNDVNTTTVVVAQ
ncbi:hypothetical protein A3D77_06995 [Candidatus Gottesmanbacteria bacterium RIFCSPHIGHO2_02_FULL_39_11]|uniref:Uncharacterized protein n=1 Tax=Candidatus Gottesmanbacteria bacterium RIFCSPHIGHO2_02_FULL_39_11 TaxID=1798382 RepID=A0A1F5ZJU3_9BACT|nr:MAG: hypothetical protein A3D77_06995 [Candidatus Gottesmanbacteria bacterium RIFCSPHIGHO2_02_FULL_39_11]